MRPSVVVEVHGKSDCCNDFLDTSEDFALQQLVLHRVVDALRLCVVLRISGFGHADLYAMLTKHVHILPTGILAAAVRVMYEIDFLALYTLQCHPQGGHRIVRVKRRPDAPADNLLAVGVKYQRQVAEVIMEVIIHDDDVCYIADP